jgi:GTP cyclohydrolase I
MSDRIYFTSICSHHFLPFTGLAWVSYIPNHSLVGASKMSRLVEHYSSRPQLQENLTHQVLNTFVNAIEPEGAMVVMRAVHSCMTCRGVKQTGGAGMQTSALHGAFFKAEVKSEALELIKLSLMS